MTTIKPIDRVESLDFSTSAETSLILEVHSRRRLSRAQRWMSDGVWAIGDQALFSITNFFINILLARWLLPREYGAFAVAFSIYFLLSTFHAAAVIEPMMIYGSGRYSDMWPRYYRSVLLVHGAVTGLVSLLLLLVGAGMLYMGNSAVAPALVALGLTSPFVLAVLVVRRACYVEGHVKSSTIAGAVYLSCVATGLIALRAVGALTSVTSLIVMGISGFVASLSVFKRLRPQNANGGGPNLREVAAAHWMYARWAGLATGMNWIPGNIFLFILPLSGGLATSAAFRALMNLVQPPLQLQQAMCAVSLAPLVRARKTHRFKQLRGRLSLTFLFSGMAYSLPVAFLRRPLIEIIYHHQYSPWANWILPILALPILLGPISGAVISLQAMERPQGILAAWAAAAATAVVLGIPASLRWGLPGAMAGLVSAYLVALVAILAQARKADLIDASEA